MGENVSREIAQYSPLQIPAEKDFDAIVNERKRLEKLAEALLEPVDFTYRVKILGEKKKKPEVFETLEEATDYVKSWEKVGKKCKITKQTRKSGWFRLALHLGVVINTPEQGGSIQTETVPMPDLNMIVQRTWGPGFSRSVWLAVHKGADGYPRVSTIRAETTIKTDWPATGRSATRTGVCNGEERAFAHPDHDVVAMSETRALCRSLAATLGFGSDIAEEFDSTEPSLEIEIKQEKEPAKGKQTQTKKESKKPATKETVKTEAKVEAKVEQKKEPTRGELIKAKASELGSQGASIIVGLFTKWKKEKEIDAKTASSLLLVLLQA